MRTFLGLMLTVFAVASGIALADDTTTTIDAAQYLVGQAPASAEGDALPSSAPQVERPAAIANGSSYGIIAPLYLHSDPITLIRLFNGGTVSAAFNISVVGTPSGSNYGTASIVVPAGGALQQSVSNILTAANITSTLPGDTTYSFYIQSAGLATGYQHIIFSNSTGFFENVSVCKVPFNQVFSSVANAHGVANVHTSALASNAYPSQIELHNYASTPVTYRIRVYEALTGAYKGAVDLPTAANSTYVIPFVSGLQTPVGWNPAANEIHANVVVTNLSGVAPEVILGHTVVNGRQTNTVLNMSTFCAVNSAPSASGQSYTVTAVASPPAGGSLSQVTVGNQVIVTAVPASGYFVEGWSGCTTSSGTTCNVTLTANTTVTATFSRLVQNARFSLQVNGSGTGSGRYSYTPSSSAVSCGTGCNTFPAGTTVTLAPLPNDGSTFGGWSGACSGTGTCQVTMNSNREVTVRFDLSSSGGGGGGTTGVSAISLGNCTQFGSAVPFTLTPALGGVSVTCRWVGNLGSTSTKTVTTLPGGNTCIDSSLVFGWLDDSVTLTATVTGTNLSASKVCPLG